MIFGEIKCIALALAPHHLLTLCTNVLNFSIGFHKQISVTTIKHVKSSIEWDHSDDVLSQMKAVQFVHF